MTITTESSARALYEQNGYAIFPDVLDRDLIAEADSHVDWLMKKHPDLRPEHPGTRSLAQ